MPEESAYASLTAEQRTELVAYLDGELDSASADRIRQLLTENAAARRAAEELTAAWEALDSLEGVRASSEFTERTLASIKTLDETDLEPEGRSSWFSLKRSAVLGAWILGVAAAGVLGFVLTNWSVPDHSAHIVRELELIRDLPRYERVESADLLLELKNRGLFDGQP